MKKYTLLHVVSMIGMIFQLSSFDALSQNARISWSVLDAGFGIPSSSTTTVKSAVGQNFVGTTILANTRIECGFLADTLFHGTVTGVNEAEQLPVNYALFQNFPNPFNPSTTIRYSLPRQSHTTLVIYNILGQEVNRLVDNMEEAGFKSIVWNGKSSTGSDVSSGVYFYVLQARSDKSDESFSQIKKLMLLK